jgi:hypothetical protein
MAHPTGEVDVQHNGKTYTLHLTMRGVAQLQKEFGQNLGPILEVKPGEMPDFDVLLRVIEIALHKRHRDEEGDLADEILSADMGVFARVIAAAFPQPDAAAPSEAEPGKRTAAA